MDIRDSTEFANRLAALGEVFDVKLSGARQALYFEALRDLDFSLLAEAMNDAVRMCRFFPKPVELRELAMGSAGDRAEAAWTLFRQLARAVGAYGSPAFTDSALERTVFSLFGTWPAACQAELNSFIHRQFLEAYQRQDGAYIRSEYGELPSGPDRLQLAD